MQRILIFITLMLLAATTAWADGSNILIHEWPGAPCISDRDCGELTCCAQVCAQACRAQPLSLPLSLTDSQPLACPTGIDRAIAQSNTHTNTPTALLHLP